MTLYNASTSGLMEEGRKVRSQPHDGWVNKKYLLNTTRSTLSDERIISTSKVLGLRGMWWDDRRWQQSRWRAKLYLDSLEPGIGILANKLQKNSIKTYIFSIIHFIKKLKLNA